MISIVFTCGDINGIGPEIVVKSFNRIAGKKNSLIFVCPGNVFLKTIKSTLPEFDFQIIKSPEFILKEGVNVLDIGEYELNPGGPSRISGRVSFDSLKTAFGLIQQKKADALVTAPISKTALKMAGIKFPGHTEILAGWTNQKKYLMTFLSPRFNAALVTIHEAIKQVPSLITREKIFDSLDIITQSAKIDFLIKKPKIAVLGLNPHAGENKIIGYEEYKIISPVIKKFNKRLSVEGPFSPDAFFGNKRFVEFDFVLGMYHDQILIPFKMMNFSNGVNFTAGLPIVRTSPDHGTAFDISGKNIANPDSIIAAYNYAIKIVKNRIYYARYGKS
jgi:4-hydroxythreonine-4-phosphate dehydrogenase